MMARVKALTSLEITDIRKILRAKERLLKRLNLDGTEKPETEEEKQKTKIDALYEQYKIDKIAAKATERAKHFVDINLCRLFELSNKEELNLSKKQFDGIERRLELWLKTHIFPYIENIPNWW